MFDSWRSKWLAAPLALAVACAAPEEGEDELELGSTQQELIRDQTSGGTAGFLWAFPIGPLLVRSNGTFEPRLAPQVVIDQVDAQGNTIKNVATYTGSVSTFGERILRNLTQKFYVVRFKSGSANLNPALNYRVKVLPAAGQPALGFADIDVVNNALDYLRVDRNKFVPLLKGGTLAIRFRIDKNAVDKDGDGVFDWLDNCPGVKNPPVSVPADVPPVTSRPGGSCDTETSSCDPQDQPLNPLAPRQPDSDNDGVGDACDCPAGQVGTPPYCDARKAFTTLCQCDDQTLFETCTDTPGGAGEPTGCVAICNAGGHGGGISTGNSLPGDPACDPSAPCPSGYEPRQPGKACKDIDECDRDTDGCEINFICRNTSSSFACLRCAEGSQNDGNDVCTPL
ncbi:MAG: hypothetical protein ABW352_18560, partial [Polyangiales bacterium]